MRFVKSALALSMASVLFLASCSASIEEPVEQRTGETSKTTQDEEKSETEGLKDKKGIPGKKDKEVLPKNDADNSKNSDSLDLSLEQAEDAQVCFELRDEMTDMMLSSVEHSADISSMFSAFDDSDEFVELSQSAHDPDIAKETEEFVVMMKAFSNYMDLGGNMDDLESPENLRLFEDAIMQLEGDEIFLMLGLSQEVLVEQKEAGDENVTYEPFSTCASLGVSFADTASF